MFSNPPFLAAPSYQGHDAAELTTEWFVHSKSTPQNGESLVLVDGNSNGHLNGHASRLNGHTNGAVSRIDTPKTSHTASYPCPICNGSDHDQRGTGSRCFGFTSGDWCHCTREEYALRAKYNEGSRAWVHLLKGECSCGVEHAPADPVPKRKGKSGLGKIDQVYPYHDADGKVVFETVRYKDPKDFRQRQVGPDGKYTWNLKGVETVLYRLPELLGADPKCPVFLTEGEKDTDRLRSLGLVSTCNPMGAGKWRPHYSESLRARHVVIIADNDDAGREHAHKVAKSLRGIAASVKVLALPGLPDKGDVSDLFDAGGSVDQLHELANAAPEWAPTKIAALAAPSSNGAVHHASETHDGRFLIANCYAVENDKGKLEYHPRSTAEIVNYLKAKTGDWPKRVDETLFLQTKDYEPIYLQSPTQLFGYLDGLAEVLWVGGPSMVTQERFYEHVRKFAAEKFKVIETAPHYPPMDGAYYMHPPINMSTNGGYLERFLDFFSPETRTDRELIRAAILTPFWGGPGGARPAFRIEGPENDDPSKGGRGTGKSTFPVMVSMLVNGYIDLEENEDFPSFKTRLLSNEEGRKRIIRVDNLKTLRLSWAPLEAFITSPIISGRALYRGECQRPNTMTTFITVNGGGLSKDMAQRVIPIRLARPKYVAGWNDRIVEFIAKHRWNIVGEIIATLAEEPAVMKSATRWSSWERDVLSKCSDFDKCQKLIADRASSIDADDDDAFEIESAFRQKLVERRHDPDAETVKIPSAIVSAWYSEYHGKKVDASTATALLKTKPFKRLRYKRTTAERFWIWQSDDSNPSDRIVNLEPLPVWSTHSSNGRA
jgi:hypothetical protein